MNYISQETPLPADQPLPSAAGHGSVMKGEFSGIIPHITLIPLDVFGSAGPRPRPRPPLLVIITAKETRMTRVYLRISGP